MQLTPQEPVLRQFADANASKDVVVGFECALSVA